jgi:TrkA domain protein
MQINIEVHDLPGIGRRYDVHGEHGGRVAVVLHNTGRRDVYSYEGGRGGGDIGDDDADAVVQLSDAQGRQLGAILGGAYFKPAMVEEVEAVIGALLIDWLTLGEDSPAVGRTIEELEIRQRTGMTIVAVGATPFRCRPPTRCSGQEIASSSSDAGRIRPGSPA